ncbi:hypothetical protein UQ52_06930 [Rickettsia conorii subsp. raoultii]|uniref:Uncharacterized protein n=1 Tax=Rickettsia conorii subsp. raoultii TaxID=369822 RepID=A0A9N7AVG6_RICCR|nr:hypothetical protein UQ52_06930 [Rickettsia conorii subsp. raoultii]
MREGQIVIARREATWQSKKIIKKILIYRIFYWLASSNYYVILLAMTENRSTQQCQAGMTLRAFFIRLLRQLLRNFPHNGVKQ